MGFIGTRNGYTNPLEKRKGGKSEDEYKAFGRKSCAKDFKERT
jgi:hypothetical protein